MYTYSSSTIIKLKQICKLNIQLWNQYNSHNNSGYFDETKLLLKNVNIAFFSMGPVCSGSHSFLCLNYSKTLVCIASHLAVNWHAYIIYLCCPSVLSH